jgi:ArsR family transcriptional regulator, arsenate/arsenite/antimonite-responsive transcriptional repressor
MTDLFDSLADPTRRDIIALLRASTHDLGEMSVGELVDALGITQPTVSKHLKVLREVGLVVVREEGQHRYYRLDEAPLRQVGEWALGGQEPQSNSAGEPLADLTTLGRAAGSLARDGLAFVDDLRTKIFR